jgi:pimeloyl-ACP methyl ester carboxylesterase
MYPERVSRMVAIEPGLAALVHQRKASEWEGWSYWVSKLEEVGLTVPDDKRTDLDFLLNLSLETPKFYGPARGLPRNRGPLINLIRNTTLMKDYEEPGSLTLEAVARILTPTFLVYGDKSHFLKSYEYLRRALPHCTSALLHGGEHFGPLERPEELTQHIRRFFTLARNESALARSPAPGAFGNALAAVGSETQGS